MRVNASIPPTLPHTMIMIINGSGGPLLVSTYPEKRERQVELIKPGENIEL